MEKHISWLEEKEKRLEKKVLAEYSSAEVRKHLEYLTTLTRIAGTEDEQKAANYIKRKLEEYGLEAEIHEFDGYISQPGEAFLKVLYPVQTSYPCLSLAFIAPTPPNGIEGELIHVGEGFEKDYERLNVKGKIALIGPVGKEDHVLVAMVAEKYGALAQIHINKGAPWAIDMAQLRETWGAPTLETIDHIPKTSVVSVCNEDGKTLIELAQKAGAKVKLKADAWRGYEKVRFPMGTVRGIKEPEKYILIAAHYCSWYKGATDNAAANSLLLEMARIFSKYRKSLARGIKFAWWTGHSQGTFAGSSWFVDNYWDDVRDNAIAYIVMDGLARMGSSGFDPRNNEEIRRFHEMVIKETLGLEVQSKQNARIGDQSFWGAGIPSATGATTFTREQAVAMGGKPIWYSHTIDDTIDKVDIELLNIPFKVNAISILRLCNNPILPFEFVSTSESFRKRLVDLQKAGKGSLDLTSLISRVEELKGKTEALNEVAEKCLSTYLKKGLDKKGEDKFKAINGAMMRLSRILIPTLTHKAGKYGQDALASKFKFIPNLQPVETMARMDLGSVEYKALRTSLLRERNRLSDTINEANRILDRVLLMK